jgi:hypothetical protein
MKLTKRTTGIAAAVVLASGLAVATTTAAFADAHGSANTAAAHSAHGKNGKDGKDGKKAGNGKRNRLLHTQHGQRTVTDKDGTTVVHEWQVGKVTAASGTSLTVVSADGTSWTWTESSQTRTRGQGKDTAVKVGDEILVQGVKSGAANDARVVVDPGAAKIAKWEARFGAAKSGQGKHHKADGSQPTGQPSQDGQPKTGTSGSPA